MLLEVFKLRVILRSCCQKTSMVSFLRCYVAIALWTYFQSSVRAAPLKVKRSASFLPQRLQPQQIDSSAVGSFLITQSRQGDRQEFALPQEEKSAEVLVGEVETIEVIADRQEYDRERGIITATGNVVMRFAQSVMTSDAIEINLNNRFAVATGNVILKRGAQVLRGSRFEYNLVADRGAILSAGGEIDRSSLRQDTDFEQRLADGTILDRALSDRLIENQPLTDVTAAEGLGVSLGSRGIDLVGENNIDSGSNIDRLRFEADRLDFTGSDWTAVNLRLTNDPFSPPELELRADTARFRQFGLAGSRLETTDSSLVIDDRLKVPLLANSFVFNDRPSRPGLFDLAFDGDERGGLYIERTWDVIYSDRLSWSLTPQYFVQRALIPTTFGFSDEEEGGVFNSSSFGLVSDIRADLAKRTYLDGSFSLTDLDFDDFEDDLRGKVELVNQRGNPSNPLELALEYNFRDRLFNGSLGFQTVRESFGGVISLPQINIWQ